MAHLDVIGWFATFAFTASYFAKKPGVLRAVQASAALLWIVYGSLMHALPVVVANTAVALAALYSAVATPGLNLRALGMAPASGNNVPKLAGPAAMFCGWSSYLPALSKRAE